MIVKITNSTNFIRILNFLQIKNFTYWKDMFENYYYFKIDNASNKDIFKLSYLYNDVKDLSEKEIGNYLIDKWKVNLIY